MAQNWNNINVTADGDDVGDTGVKIVANFEVLKSNFSGTTFPTANLVVGMNCWRTDQNKQYVLTSVSPVTWVEMPRVDGTIANATNAVNATNATKVGGKALTDLYLKTDIVDKSKELVVETTSLLYRKNFGAYTSDAATLTGIIKITVPDSWANTMFALEIDGYMPNYGAYKIIIGGYNYASGAKIADHNVSVVGNFPYRVRLAFDGSKYCILLGATNTVWAYPKLLLSGLIAGYMNFATSDNAFAFSLITAETGISKVVEPVVNAYMMTNILYRGTAAPTNTLLLWLNTTNRTLNFYDGAKWATIVGTYGEAT